MRFDDEAEPQAPPMTTPCKALKMMAVDDKADAAQIFGMFIEEVGHHVLIE